MDVEHPHTYSNTFNIRTEVYSGPLDLLIDLIEKRKFLVNDISIAAVTDDYMQYVARFEKSPLKDMTDFVVLASTLLLLKSKSLLPILDLTEAEEESVETLQSRLKLYQIYRNAGKVLSEIFNTRTQFGRKFIQDTTPMFVPDKYADTEELHSALSRVIHNLPKKVEKPKVQVKKMVTLETMMDRLKQRIESQLKCSFTDFTGGSGERTTIVVGFLAVLEMVKQGGVLVHQSARFTEIQIEQESKATPVYH